MINRQREAAQEPERERYLLPLTWVEFSCVILSKTFWSIIYIILIGLDAGKIFPNYTCLENAILDQMSLLQDFPGSFMCSCLLEISLRMGQFIECFPSLLDYFVFEVCPGIRFDGTQISANLRPLAL